MWPEQLSAGVPELAQTSCILIDLRLAFPVPSVLGHKYTMLTIYKESTDTISFFTFKYSFLKCKTPTSLQAWSICPCRGLKVRASSRQVRRWYGGTWYAEDMLGLGMLGLGMVGLGMACFHLLVPVCWRNKQRGRGVVQYRTGASSSHVLSGRGKDWVAPRHTSRLPTSALPCKLRCIIPYSLTPL